MSAIQLFERLPENPVVTAAWVTEALATSKPTAGKAIEQLISAGILEELGDRKRDRLYRYTAYVDILTFRLERTT